MSEVTIDREANIAKNTDAAGKVWKIFTDRQTGLAFTRPDPDREDAVIPKLVAGRWTKIPLLEAALARYLELNWNEAEAQRKKNARSNLAKAEADTSSIAKLPDPTYQKTVLTAEAVSVELGEKPSHEEIIQAAVDAENAAIAAAEDEGMIQTTTKG